ncbi:universal stress protein [Ancylobacter terrae]|uniref:universal stress protein n=1 Tax=Ancylobacter sp. sgz301288 TaxID=3342077 RepID=UPI00385C3BA0
MPRTRRSHEEGHRRKFLVVVDDTPECDRAVYYAARRAARTAGGLVMLATFELDEAGGQWLGVADLMRAEATDHATARLGHYAARARALSGIEAEVVVREGVLAAAIAHQVETDEDIGILVLASSAAGEGAGPLVHGLLSGNLAAFPIPVTIVPGMLTDAEIDALA